MSNRYDCVPVACDNKTCRHAQNCLRYEAWEANAKERVKTFNGTQEKGCGKFIPRPKKGKEKLEAEVTF